MEAKRNIHFIDGLRGIAASLVMIGHARWLLHEDNAGYLKHSIDYNLIDKLLYYFFKIFRFGHEAVILFFVISGFVIHLKYARRIKKDADKATFDFKVFLTKRVKRLYPIFLLTVIITFILDSYGKYLGAPIYFGKTAYPLINANIYSITDVKTLIGNLFFLMNVYVPVWGSFSPSWSLMYEWWFYMIYPLMFFVNRKHVFIAFILMCLFSIMGIYGLFPLLLLNKVLTLMICWWLGTLLADIYAGRLPFFDLKYVSYCMLIVVLLPFIKNDTYYDIGLSVFYLGLISLLLYLASRGKHLKAIVWFKPIGDYSYTLYAIHMPFLVFTSGMIMKLNKGLLPMNSYFIIAFIIFIYPVSYLFYRLVEKRFIQ